MFETPLTVVGNIVNDPIRRRIGDQELLKFRMASNSRRRGADGTWETDNSLFVTVNCWGRLVTGVGASVGKGSPVIVVGHVYTSEYEDRAGSRRSMLEMRATAVGPDLSRCAARIEKLIAARPDTPAWSPAESVVDTDVADTGNTDDPDHPDDLEGDLRAAVPHAEDGLSLSA